MTLGHAWLIGFAWGVGAGILASALVAGVVLAIRAALATRPTASVHRGGYAAGEQE